MTHSAIYRKRSRLDDESADIARGVDLIISNGQSARFFTEIFDLESDKIFPKA